MAMARTWLRPALLCATVLLHVVALLLVLGQPAARRDDAAAPAMDLVWVRTPPPKPPQPDAPARIAPPPPAKAVKAQRSVRATVASKAPTSESTLVAVPAEQPAPAGPATEAAPFDREGALQTARKIAREVDPVVPGTKYQETRDEKLGRAIAGAKRANCLGGNASGNLLTPLMWLIEKKDSGCKF